jgi:hypothetical protein
MRGTFTHHNPDFLEDIKEMLSLGFKELSMEPVVCAEDDPSALTAEDLPVVMKQYEELAELMLKKHKEGDGFTAGVDADGYTPTGDLVAYSFYNNDSASDELGWNSIGQSINGDNRNKPTIPAFTAPEEAGVYRLRFKQDWCNIDPQGDADGKFGDFKQNGGQIIDLLLVVTNTTGISEVKGESGEVKGVYDLTGRKLEQITAPGVYIVNGKKVLVK